jgi:uncharacterized protein
MAGMMIERPWGVSAYGAASVKAMPDLVRVRFQVGRLAPTPAESFGNASQAVHAVREALRRHGIPDGAVDRSRLALKSSWSYGPDRKFLGYNCSASFAVQSADLDGVERLIVDIVEAGANEIDSVDFDVAKKQEMRAEARRRAVAAARDKAALYTDAAGARLGPVVHIEDVDPERANVERYRGHSLGEEAAAADLAPGHVVVSAAVTVGFSIAHD